jgi:hypothetical protein
MSTATPAFVLDGNLRADGTIVLDASPPLPPGRVRVAVQELEVESCATVRLPDPPWLDDSISPPCDLPHLGEVRRVEPRRCNTPRLPEPFEEPS